jgi:hypothetical protein
MLLLSLPLLMFAAAARNADLITLMISHRSPER